MKNKFTDLNNHLFAQIERLGDESLTGEDLKTEISRAKAMAGVASQVVGVGRLVLDAAIAVKENQLTANPVEQLTHEKKDTA